MTSGAIAGISKAERAYRWIAECITTGALRPGTRLVLDQLARDLDISPVPVREAIRRLEAEGMVEFVRNVGARVALVDPVEYLHTMETLAIIEGAATGKSAPLLTPEDVATARGVNHAMRLCLEEFNPERFTELNRQFHTVLYSRCDNPHILDLVHRGWARLASLRTSSFAFIPDRALASVHEHDDLLGLVEARCSPVEIEAAARAHRLNTLGAMRGHQAQGHQVLAPSPEAHARPTQEDQ